MRAMLIALAVDILPGDKRYLRARHNGIMSVADTLSRMFWKGVFVVITSPTQAFPLRRTRGTFGYKNFA